MNKRKEDGFIHCVACICVRSDDENEVLLITSSILPNVWVLPGGSIEAKEEASAGALRKMSEQAGVDAKIDRCLGIFENNAKMHRTHVFVLTCTAMNNEWDQMYSLERKRRWFALDNALAVLALHRPGQKDYLMQLKFFKTGEIPKLPQEVSPDKAKILMKVFGVPGEK